MPYRVVFVCLGNICRSPIAEQVFRDGLADSPVSDLVAVSSAGTGSWHVGEPMDRRAAEVLRRNGYSAEHVAQQFTVDSFDDPAPDLVLAMDRTNLAALHAMAPPDRIDQIRLFRSFDPAAPPDAEVPDPYYGGPDGFTDVLAMVEAAAAGLIDHLESLHR